MNKPKLVAEIGCNHKGEVDIAKKMIRVASECGADVAKFQKRNPEELLTKEEYETPHPVPHNSYGNGKGYGYHREALEFDIETHVELLETCQEYDIEYSTSVWDMTSAEEVIEYLQPKHIKVPSANATWYRLIDYLFENTEDTLIHISTGMMTKDEKRDLLSHLGYNCDTERAVVYHCTSDYPVDFEDVCLQEIKVLNSAYTGVGHYSRGFSGHHKGIAIDNAAFALGAEWIERHFTLDRTWKGTDHAASLEPQGLKKLKRDLIATWKSIDYKGQGLLECEKEQAKKLRWDRKDWK